MVMVMVCFEVGSCCCCNYGGLLLLSCGQLLQDKCVAGITCRGLNFGSLKLVLIQLFLERLNELRFGFELVTHGVNFLARFLGLQDLTLLQIVDDLVLGLELGLHKLNLVRHFERLTAHFIPNPGLLVQLLQFILVNLRLVCY